MYKDYGLTGKIVKVKKKVREMTKPDPWGNTEVRMKVTAEYPNYLCVEVLPHKNPDGQGISRPYPTTIHKNDIQTGEVILKEE